MAPWYFWDDSLWHPDDSKKNRMLKKNWGAEVIPQFWLSFLASKTKPAPCLKLFTLCLEMWKCVSDVSNNSQKPFLWADPKKPSNSSFEAAANASTKGASWKYRTIPRKGSFSWLTQYHVKMFLSICNICRTLNDSCYRYVCPIRSIGDTGCYHPSTSLKTWDDGQLYWHATRIHTQTFAGGSPAQLMRGIIPSRVPPLQCQFLFACCNHCIMSMSNHTCLSSRL